MFSLDNNYTYRSEHSYFVFLKELCCPLWMTDILESTSAISSSVFQHYVETTRVLEIKTNAIMILVSNWKFQVIWSEGYRQYNLHHIWSLWDRKLHYPPRPSMIELHNVVRLLSYWRDVLILLFRNDMTVSEVLNMGLHSMGEAVLVYLKVKKYNTVKMMTGSWIWLYSYQIPGKLVIHY